jgi:hypothetical protein
MHSDSLNNQPASSQFEPAGKPRLNRRQEIVDDFGHGEGEGEFLFLSEPEFDEAILGVAKRIGQADVIAYDSNTVYEILAKMLDTEDWTVVFEYFEFNILGAYVGERTPVFVDVVFKPKAAAG